jgi:hypothetical protein
MLALDPPVLPTSTIIIFHMVIYKINAIECHNNKCRVNPKAETHYQNKAHGGGSQAWAHLPAWAQFR